jgi:predicted SAM-dependent methyltransferase
MQMGEVYEIALTNATAVEAYTRLNQGTVPTLLYLMHDLTTKLPFSDGSIETIFSEHFIEHVHMGDGVSVLAEARRLLAKGGTLRLSTPDFGRFASAYAAAAERPGDPRGDGWFDDHFDVLSKTTGINSLHPYMSARPMDIINQVEFQHG